jgi:competence protein ComEC
VILFFVFGFLYSHARHIDLPEIVLPEHDVVLEGTILGSPSVSRDIVVFTLDEIHLGDRTMIGKVRLYILLRKYSIESAERIIYPGNRIRAVTGLKKTYALSNPGVYAYDLRRNGVFATGYVKKLTLLSEGPGVLRWIYKKRRRLGAIMNRSLSTDNASFLKAIIPGFKGGINPEIRDAFSSTGLAHLLSISGTHFGLLAFIIFMLVKSLIKMLPHSLLVRMTIHITPSQAAVLMTMPVLLLYACISGLSTPTIRSVIMVSIYMIALFLGRKDQWLNSLSIAAVLILLWKPATLFGLSFILSFLAVLSIGYVAEGRKEKTDDGTQKRGAQQFIAGILEKAKTAPLMTIAAVLGTAPVVAVVFKQFPLISPLTNIIVTPLVCFVLLPLGFFSGICALIFDMQVMPLHGLIDTAAGSALKLIDLFSKVPYSNIHVHNPSFVHVALYYMSLILMLRLSAKSRLRFLPFILVICLYLAVPRLSDKMFRVTFLDAGQGDTSVVDLPDGKVMLVDGSTGKPDMGRRVVAPYLWSSGKNRIDYIVLSHPHPDHYGGLKYVLNNFDVGEIWISGRLIAGSEDFFNILNDKKVKYKVFQRGDILESDWYRIYVLHPYDEFNAASSRGEHSDQNNDSLVLKIETESASVLFTGDIEQESEGNLLYLGKWLKSDILKVPHHGSQTSSTEEFIRAVSPRIAVISVGRNNPFKHPHEKVLRRYHDDDIQLFRTDIHGAVSIEIRQESLIVTTDEDRSLRKVTGWRDEIRNLMLLHKP